MQRHKRDEYQLAVEHIESTAKTERERAKEERGLERNEHGFPRGLANILIENNKGKPC